MAEIPAATRNEFENRIVARATQDEGYLARLKSDPRAAIADETGIRVPESVTIEVLEETPDHAYLVIPTNRIAIDDEQLEVAGGYCHGPPGPCT
jgi:hypothetical protein